MFRIVLLLLLGSFSAFSQLEVDERSSLKERIYFGAGVGFLTGTGFTQFSLNPLVGYMVNSRFSTGIVIRYQNYIYSFARPSFSIQQYGLSPFVRYKLNQEFFLYGEYSLINSPSFITRTSERALYTRLPVGLGYFFPVGNKRGGFNTVLLYDLIYKNQNSAIFQSPLVTGLFYTF